MVGVNQDAIINKLLGLGVISRTTRRGHYTVVGSDSDWNRDRILARYAYNPSDPITGEILSDRWLLLLSVVNHDLQHNATTQRVTARPTRTITRNGYHTATRNYAQYIARVAPDADGVRRTFGLEYEIYTLNAEQESELAYLLDTLPAHVTERDGSLGCGGVEIIFMPMSAADYIATVTTLGQFISQHNIQMSTDNDGSGAGMHTTYGVSNGEASLNDLQIRLNRYCLALAALATKPKIKEIFGRTFGHYRSIPQSTTEMTHGNSFSCAGRPQTCWECRLPNWKANPAKLVEFFKITETAFHRPFNGSDLAALANFLDCGYSLE